MSPHELEAARYVVREIREDLSRLESKVDAHSVTLGAHGAQLESLSGLMTTLNADQSKLRSEVHGKLAELVTEDDVDDIVTGKHKLLELEQAKSVIAEARAEKAKREEDEKRKLEEREKERRAFRGKIAAGVLLLLAGAAISHVVTRVSIAPPASASTR